MTSKTKSNPTTYCPAMKKSLLLIAAAFLSVLPAMAKEDVPRGFSPLTELKEAQAKAAKDKKMVVLVVKGMDDACPYCAAALTNGLGAVGSGVVKVFARAETIREVDSSGFPEPLQARIKQGFTTGAAVTFLVFDAEMNKIVAEAGRSELQDDRKAIAAFKKTISEARKATK